MIWAARALLLFLVTGLGVRTARADGASGKVAAEALFAEGRDLMAEGKYGEACRKFADSLRLDRGVGTMLNLADCYEKNGQTASAWAEFQEASAAARDAASPEREQEARERARALEPKLSRLTIELAPGQVSGVKVLRDGEELDGALLGNAIPIDPGRHKVEASAPGKRSWSQSVHVPSSPGSTTLIVPVLESDTAAPPSGLSADGTLRPSDTRASSGGWQVPVGITVGALGIVGVGVGTFFGLQAKSSWDEADEACPSRRACSDEAVSKGDDADQQATLSTIGFAVGGVGLAVGTVLLLSAPDSKASGRARPALRVALRPGALTLEGRY